jgi:hypothetical protein
VPNADIIVSRPSTSRPLGLRRESLLVSRQIRVIGYTLGFHHLENSQYNCALNLKLKAAHILKLGRIKKEETIEEA